MRAVCKLNEVDAASGTYSHRCCTQHQTTTSDPTFRLSFGNYSWIEETRIENVAHGLCGSKMNKWFIRLRWQRQRGFGNCARHYLTDILLRQTIIYSQPIHWVFSLSLASRIYKYYGRGRHGTGIPKLETYSKLIDDIDSMYFAFTFFRF